MGTGITYTMTGHMGQTEVSFTWTDGTVTSDNAWALFIFNIHAEAMEGYWPRRAPFMPTRYHHVRNPRSATVLMQMCFTDVGRITAGQLPQVKPPPEGVIY